ncbi:hypothetical protein [Cellulomonas massiliensis]|uniref:hypothetical protein n=1 Tax=Cellulomonas massiliensis TaxID=1465811 RepID=UPI00031C5B46|nr:hypothetical protein [Cellulomonas massiliensis]
MRLVPGLRVLPRGDGEVQVGTDPRWAVRVDGLAPAEVEALLALNEHPLAPVPEALAGPLTDAGLTLAAGDTAGAAPPAEAATWPLLHAAPPARGAAVVAVMGLGPTGLTVVLALAAAGVGTLLLDDERLVTAADVGAGGYRWTDVGSPREAVAGRCVRDVAPTCLTDTAEEPDVLVVVDQGATDPGQALTLLGSGVPHLPVVLREADALVGPLVVPGSGPCLHCLDLHRADVDPAWPRVALALTTHRTAPAGEAAHLAAVAGGLAAAAVLTLLDGAPATGVSYEVPLPDVVPRTRRWAVHPHCGCTALVAVPAAAGPS